MISRIEKHFRDVGHYVVFFSDIRFDVFRQAEDATIFQAFFAFPVFSLEAACRYVLGPGNSAFDLGTLPWLKPSFQVFTASFPKYLQLDLIVIESNGKVAGEKGVDSFAFGLKDVFSLHRRKGIDLCRAIGHAKHG
jgi:hypothetical protein